MNDKVRKLNKRAIYWSLMALVFLSVPALVALVSPPAKARTDDITGHNAPHASLNNKDAFALAGVERFPGNYGDVRDFEKELGQDKSKEDNLIKALEEFENTGPRPNASNHHQASYYGHNDNPWRDSAKRDQKQRASDHYEARRSDIMFINKNNKKEHERDAESNHDDRVLKMMERSLDMAEKSMAETNQDDVFFVKKNNQKEIHKEFLARGRAHAHEVEDASPYSLSEGMLIPATLLSEINTDLPGPILARVSHNIWDSSTGKFLLIPQNSKLIGEYNSAVGDGQSRAQIVWTRIIYPNGQSVSLDRMVGIDKKGTSGSAGDVDNHYDKVAIGIAMSTALGAGVRLTQGKYEPNNASMGQELGNSLAQETARFGNKIAQKMLGIKPTIKVAIGERLNVFVETDLHLKPYKD